MARQLSRREALLRLAGSLFACCPSWSLLAAGKQPRSLFASGYMDQQRGYGIALLDQQGELVATYPLPQRGHGIAVAPATAAWHWVSFARRPGNMALAVDLSGHQPPLLFNTPQHTHFYGHGAFSADGQRLFASENQFDAEQGVIGIYDASARFARLGAFPSYGIGPHEIIMMPDGETLCVANGGILTHPDTGRTKLNLHEMQSSVVFINSRNGELIAKFALPESLQRLSLRHLAVDHLNSVWIGGQYQGDAVEPVPLIANISKQSGLNFPAIDPTETAKLANYVGSVASNHDTGEVAFTSPKGNSLLIMDAEKKCLLRQKSIPAVCGVAAAPGNFFTTSHSGEVDQQRSQLFWDNHMVKL